MLYRRRRLVEAPNGDTTEHHSISLQLVRWSYNPCFTPNIMYFLNPTQSRIKKNFLNNLPISELHN